MLGTTLKNLLPYCLTETFRGCQIHFRKIQLGKGTGRVVVELSLLFYRVFLCGVRVSFSYIVKIVLEVHALLGPLSWKKMLGYSSISKAPKNRTHMHHISWIIAKSNQPIWPILASKFGQNFQKFSYKNNFCTRWRSKKMLLVFNSFTQQIFSD